MLDIVEGYNSAGWTGHGATMLEGKNIGEEHLGKEQPTENSNSLVNLV